MRYERRLLDQEEVDQAPQHGRGVVDARVSGLAEKVGQQRAGFLVWQLRRGAQFVDDTAEQHGLALAGIALDPEQSALLVVTPLLKIGVAEDPAVRAFQQAALSVLDTLLVVAGIGGPQALEASVVFAFGI